MTSGRKRKRDDVDDETGGTRQHSTTTSGATGASESRSVQESLEGAGYKLTPTGGMLVPLIRIRASPRLVEKNGRQIGLTAQAKCASR